MLTVIGHCFGRDENSSGMLKGEMIWEAFMSLTYLTVG